MIRRAAALLLAAATIAPAFAADPLAEGFADPPASARPRVWWHWLNGNITQDGIEKDLRWMKRAGIGGLQNFNGAMMTPQIVAKPLAYMSPGWKDAFRYTAGLADELGLELAVASSPGWSESGGPWVPSADGMKKLVWSQTDVVGGRRFAAVLPRPAAATGAFQDVGPSIGQAALAEPGGKPPEPYYADAVVLAYPVAEPADARPTGETPDGRRLDVAALSDGRFATSVALPRTAGAPPRLVLRYARPQRIRTATLFIPDALPPFGDAAYLPLLEAQVDGVWRTLAALPLTGVPTTVSFPAVEARLFRLTLAPNTGASAPSLAPPAPGAVMFDIFPSAPSGAAVPLGEFSLSASPRIDRFEAKAAFSTERDYYALGQGDEAPGIDPAQVIDLTARLRADGTLDWTPPKGRWRILRLGASLTGTTNHPAAADATGLEVDKYDGAAVRRYMNTYLGLYRDAAGADRMGNRGLRALLNDSIEAGDANWTPRLIERFRALRGYDPTPWLPALTGAIVGSRGRSDAFLYDYRRTLADLIASEHYGTIAQIAHANGLTLYGEALENGRPLLGDDMAMRSHAEIPMGAMWTFSRGDAPRPTLLGDLRGAASVAHVYGKPIVAAESLTSAFAPWAFAPADLRPVIDLEFASGVNRPVIHTSVHQPSDDKVPGLSLAIFGQYFNRHETWAEMARPWIDYIARSSFLLQQGRAVADVAYFYGEEAPITALAAAGPLPDTPTRYGYDFVNADILARELSVDGVDLVSRGGARYRLLYLGGSSRRMTLPTLRRIADLAVAGATIVGQPPTGSPSLNDDPAAFAAIVKRLWGGAPETIVGRGRVIAGTDVEAALAARGVLPDFEHAGPQPDSRLLFLHRALPDGDLYFVSNRTSRAQSIDARFRVAARAPDLWRADDGSITPASYRIDGGRTTVTLPLEPEESLFVLFRRAADASSLAVAPHRREQAADLSTGWTVSFQPGRGAPAAARFATLAPLDVHADPGIRYFSGIATYRRGFTLPKGIRPGQPLELDLGMVGDVAEVKINGRIIGTLWHAPDRIDIGGAVRRGANSVEIRVADLWVNRLIGDAQAGASKVTFTTLPTYRADAPLRPSGLIGPVTLSTRGGSVAAANDGSRHSPR